MNHNCYLHFDWLSWKWIDNHLDIHLTSTLWLFDYVFVHTRVIWCIMLHKDVDGSEFARLSLTFWNSRLVNGVILYLQTGWQQLVETSGTRPETRWTGMQCGRVTTRGTLSRFKSNPPFTDVIWDLSEMETLAWMQFDKGDF